MPRERTLYISYDRLDELAKKFHPENPKGHDLQALSDSFDRFGFIDPTVVNDTTGNVIAGHGRVEALLLAMARGESPPHGVQVGEDGTWLVPVVHGPELDKDDARAYLVAANRLVELGGWNERALARLLENLASSVTGLEGIGFSVAELDALVAGLSRHPPAEKDVDDAPAAPQAADLYVSRGQTYTLGKHRLRCGDATDATDVDALMNGHNAAMAITDPPYNVDYGRHGGASGAQRSIANDHLDPAAWEQFVRGWAAQLVGRTRGAIYVFMSSREWPLVCRLLAEAGGHWSDSLIWAKDQFTLGRADYQRQFEPIWYGWPKGAKHHWCGDRAQGDVWQFPKPLASRLHPTMKPVALLEKAIANSSPRGAIVLDLFSGSGSTLIAAERQGRICYAMELDPIYTQVSIERWKSYTGRTARLEEDG